MCLKITRSSPSRGQVPFPAEVLMANLQPLWLQTGRHLEAVSSMISSQLLLHSRRLICCLFPHLRYLPKDIQWVSPFTWPFITLGYPLATGTHEPRSWAHYALCLSLREWGVARGRTKVSPFSLLDHNQNTVDGLWAWTLLHCLSVQSCPVLNGSWHEV